MSRRRPHRRRHVGRPAGREAARHDEAARRRAGRVAADAATSWTSASAKVFADVVEQPARLLVYGAVDTADALCAAAKLLGWHTVVADARARFATRERLPNADEILVAWPEEALEQVKPDLGTAVVLLTHDDKFDFPMLRGTLATDAFYVGLLGSRRNQERRRALLREEGVSDEQLDRISGPSGLDIGAEHAGRDRALHPGRDPVGPRRPLGRLAQGVAAPHPRRAGRADLPESAAHFRGPFIEQKIKSRLQTASGAP